MVSIDVVREAATGTGLDVFIGPILADNLPQLDNSAPLTLPPPREILYCRYCDEAFDTFSKMRRHLKRTKATCQLSHPHRLDSYLDLLNAHIAASDLCYRTGPDDAERTSGYTQDFARHELDSSSESETEETEAYGTTVPPSLLHWSEQEKGRFYRALSRHSRLRPDLIALDIGTKNSLQVVTMIDYLDSQVSLLDEADHTVPAQFPAAREMSEKWLDMEAGLAEDCVVWEAFVEETDRTPRQLRDAAQLALRADDTFSCLAELCEERGCDGQWPVCGTCKRNKTVCEWPGDFHPNALPESNYST